MPEMRGDEFPERTTIGSCSAGYRRFQRGHQHTERPLESAGRGGAEGTITSLQTRWNSKIRIKRFLD